MKKINLVFSEKEISFHFGLGFMGELLESLDCSIDELMKKLDKNPFKIIPKLMYESHSYSCLRQGKESEYGIIEFTDLIDEDGGIMSEKTAKFLEAFTSSIVKDVPKEEVNPVKRGVKKPTPKKK